MDARGNHRRFLAEAVSAFSETLGGARPKSKAGRHRIGQRGATQPIDPGPGSAAAGSQPGACGSHPSTDAHSRCGDRPRPESGQVSRGNRGSRQEVARQGADLGGGKLSRNGSKQVVRREPQTRRADPRRTGRDPRPRGHRAHRHRDPRPGRSPTLCRAVCPEQRRSECL